MLPRDSKWQPFGADLYPRVLASLSEKALLLDIHEKACGLDALSLKSALDARAFEAFPYIDASHSNKAHTDAFLAQWCARCSAAMGAMATTSLSQEKKGDDGRSYAVRFEIDGPMEAFYAEFFDDLLGQVDLLRMQMGSDATQAITQVVAQAMCLASMMDRADLLEGLQRSCPDAVQRLVPEEKMASCFSQKRSEDDLTMDVSPLFMALQCSSESCVRLLLKNRDKNLTMYRCTVEQEDLGPVGFLESFKDIQHRGSTAAMVPVMQQMLRDALGDADAQPQLDAIVKTLGQVAARLSNGDLARNANTLPACIEAGWVDVDAVQAMSMAMQAGHASIVQHLRGSIPWAEVAQMPTVASQAIGLNAIEAYEALVAIAKEEGGDAKRAVLRHFSGEEGIPTSMAESLTQMPAGVALLAQLLDIGLDPKTKTQEGPDTLMDVAKASQTKAAAILGSFVARSQAHALIEEMDKKEGIRHAVP